MWGGMSGGIARRAAGVSMIHVVTALAFTAVTPLLPTFERDFHLSKAEVGILVAVFPAGQAFSALPVNLLSSVLTLKKFSVGGLTILAGASLAFGLLDSYDWLLAARFAQGVGAGLCFASGLAWLVDIGSKDRRAEMIGYFASAGAAGTMLGPVVGGLAVVGNRSGVFAVLAAGAIGVALVVGRVPESGMVGPRSTGFVRQVWRLPEIWLKMWLVVLPGILLGTIFALAPLQLDRLGMTGLAIAAIFFLAALVGVVARLVTARWTDRRGAYETLALLIATAIPLTIAIPWIGAAWLLAGCVLFAICVYGLLWAPAMAVISRAFQDAGVAQVVGFAAVVIPIGLGFIVGSAAGGRIGRSAGDASAYSFAAGLCVLTFTILLARQRYGSRSVATLSTSLDT